MIRILAVLVLMIFYMCTIEGFPDLMPEAITVYRNPEFFKNLDYGARLYYNKQYQKQPKNSEDKANDYKYPGETKKPNPPPASSFEVNFDDSPEFIHEPRVILVDTTYKPNRRKGPYGHKYSLENSQEESAVSKDKHAESEVENEELKEESEESDTSSENSDADEGVQDFGSSLDEEFKAYHEPVLMARSGFDPDTSSEFSSGTYSRPYTYNRTTPILYEKWKYYTYPKIHHKGHLKSEPSSLYSEEPASNAFEENSYPYDKYDSAEDVTNYFDHEYSSLGSDSKHIYKKLLNPKKSALFKFNSKPKLKKLKLKLKKKHFHNSDWFNEYPFDF